MHGEVVHFEIPAKNFNRAKAFYSEVFGWKTNDTKMPSGGTYTYLTTTEVDDPRDPNQRPKSPGAINGGMMKLRKPYASPILTIQVDDISVSLRSITKKGGKVVVGRTEMGKYGAYGYFKDTEGNLMGLFEAPKT
jgi:hypothetical protein